MRSLPYGYLLPQPLLYFGVAATNGRASKWPSDVRNMGVAAKGTGQAFNGMATSINNSMFSDIAKPYVFEAYGLGLIALQHQSKTTAGVIQTVGGQIDKWMAEAVIAYQKSTGKLAQGGATDLGMLGDAFKQVGTIIHGFTKIAPGYAKDLLSIGDAVLHAVSAILNSGFVQALGKVFLALHGAIFYLGLFATLSEQSSAWPCCLRWQRSLACRVPSVCWEFPPAAQRVRWAN